jgi:hypothetical protein
MQLRVSEEHAADEHQNSENSNDAVSGLDLILEAFLSWLI